MNIGMLAAVGCLLCLYLLIARIPKRIDTWIDKIQYQDVVKKLSDVPEKDPSVIYWLSDVFLAFHEDGTKSEYAHQVVFLPTPLRIGDHEKTAILHPVNIPVSQKVEAYHYPSEGKRKRAKINKIDSVPVETPNGTEIFKGHGIQFVNLAAGDTVELSYTRDFHKPSPQGKFSWDAIFLNLDYPYCARRRITIAIHKKASGQLVPHNFDIAPKHWTNGNYQYWQWDIQNLESYKEEFAQPSVRDCQPWIDVSTCPSWEPILRWLYKHLITPVKSQKKVKEILEKIVNPSMSLWEKAKACYDYCVNQIAYGRESSLSYFDNAQAGDQVAKIRRGDCKDQTSLLIALFAELGIESDLAVVSTQDGGKTTFLPSQRFDHAILRCKIGNEYFWLDPTAKHVIFGHCPQELEGCQAMLISREKAGEWVEIPYSSKDKNRTIYSGKVQFYDTDLKVCIDMIYYGHFASMLRGYTMYNPKFVEENVGKVFSDRIGACNVDQAEIQEGWRNRDPFHIKAQLTAKNWLKTAGTLHLLKLPWLGCHFSPMTVSEQKRKKPYLVTGPEQVECHIEIQIPQQYKMEKIPHNQKFQTYGHTMEIIFTEKTKESFQYLWMDIMLHVDCHIIPVEEYGSYRDFVYQVNKFFENSIVLLPMEAFSQNYVG